uniref:NADH-ubiquinone oxidoreductase chain 1 n=1 Tax=Nepiomorpha sp. NespEL TaxID=1940904 RepID=A0A8K1ZG39_9NEOP|nr:NADH dehydrogenase subunit 1 [Nepiomorpha sp. NespEL]
MMSDLLSSLIVFFLLFITVLIGVAFLTLLERKVLGYIQIRKGPNKVGWMGLLQPFSDAVKLFSKESSVPTKSNYLVYYFCPIVSFMMVYFSWILVPFFWVFLNFSLGVLFLMVCLGMGVYGVMVAGWSSNSSYALLGGLRAVAQTISYEVSLAFILLNLFILCGSYSFMSFTLFQDYCWFIFVNFPLFKMLFTSMLAETNRTPFDFAEGESELVSGFNIEYSSGGFAMIFLAEYGSILFMSFMISVMFLGGKVWSLVFYLVVTFMSFLFIWLRGTLPRYRYDKLMNLCWKSFLPVSLFMMIFYFSISCYINLLTIF